MRMYDWMSFEIYLIYFNMSFGNRTTDVIKLLKQFVESYVLNQVNILLVIVKNWLRLVMDFVNLKIIVLKKKNFSISGFEKKTTKLPHTNPTLTGHLCRSLLGTPAMQWTAIDRATYLICHWCHSRNTRLHHHDDKFVCHYTNWVQNTRCNASWMSLRWERKVNVVLIPYWMNKMIKSMYGFDLF